MTLRRPVSVVMPVPLWLVAGRAGTAGRGHTLAPCENVFIARCNKRRVAGAGGFRRHVGRVEPAAKPIALRAGPLWVSLRSTHPMWPSTGSLPRFEQPPVAAPRSIPMRYKARGGELHPHRGPDP